MVTVVSKLSEHVAGGEGCEVEVLFLEHIKTELHRFLFVCNTRYGEVLSGILAIGWGWTLFQTEGTTASATASVLRVLGGFADLRIMGLVMLCLGWLQIVGGACGLNSLRRGSSLVMVPFYAIITVLFLASGQRTPSVLAYAGAAVLCSWTYIRLAKEGTALSTLWRILWVRDTQFFELASLGIALWWVVLFLGTSNVLALPQYRVLAEIAGGSGEVYGLTLTLYVLVYITGLVVTWRWLRLLTNMAGLLVWSTLCACFVFTGGVLPGLGLYGVLTVFHALVFIRLWANTAR